MPSKSLGQSYRVFKSNNVEYIAFTLEDSRKIAKSLAELKVIKYDNKILNEKVSLLTDKSKRLNDIITLQDSQKIIYEKQLKDNRELVAIKDKQINNLQMEIFSTKRKQMINRYAWIGTFTVGAVTALLLTR